LILALHNDAFVNTVRDFQATEEAGIAARPLASQERLLYMEFILNWRDYIGSSEVSEWPGVVIR
jgi:hypothetical protein